MESVVVVFVFVGVSVDYGCKVVFVYYFVDVIEVVFDCCFDWYVCYCCFFCSFLDIVFENVV